MAGKVLVNGILGFDDASSDDEAPVLACAGGASRSRHANNDHTKKTRALQKAFSNAWLGSSPKPTAHADVAFEHRRSALRRLSAPGSALVTIRGRNATRVDAKKVDESQ